MGRVLSDPVVSVPGMELLDRLVELDRSINRLEAERCAVLAELAETPDPDGREWIVLDVARALAVADATAACWLHESAMLVQLPRVFAAAQAGHLSRTKTRILVDAAAKLVARRLSEAERRGLLGRFEDEVLPRAISQTPGELRRRVTRITAKLMPVSLVEAERDAEADRGVTAWTEAAQAIVQFRLTADGAEIVMTAIDAHAGKGENDTRTVDQRRADALVAICTNALYGTAPGSESLPRTESWQGRRPAVNVTVPLSSLLGGEASGELAGFGPISADLARELAFDPTAAWTTCIVDEGGRLLYRGATSYRPPAQLREYVLTRDGVCAMPGCLRAARRCELDHVRDWQHGGPTDPDNLQPLCARHHHAKHDAGWQPQRLNDGSTEWTSPRGRIYRKPAHVLPTDTTPVAADPDPPPF